MTYFLPGYSKYKQPSISTPSFQTSFTWLVWMAALLGVSALLALVMFYRGPGGYFLAWLMYFLGIALILYQPRYGIYLILGLTLVGDVVLTPWFPFVKNFSSRESVLFLNDALIFNPLETYLAATFLSWLVHSFSNRKLKIFRGPLLFPALGFLGFVIFGFFYGIRTGGNLNIALWEARPLFYLVVMLFLVSNLLEKREHISNLLWAAMLGIFIESIFGNWYYFVRLRGNLAGVNAITEHPAAVHMNTLIVFFLAAWLYKMSPRKRLVLSLMVPIIMIPYIATQRRAAFITLGIALIVIAVLLFKENRRAFWSIVPLATIVLMGYLAAFWNLSGPLALPAEAAKSVLVPSQSSAADQASDAYRDIENFNLHFTLRQKPLTGIGFGQKFYVVIPMPDISWFQWWQYFPHNSIIWIWLKTGAFGFAAMLYMLGISIMVGARALWRMPRNELSAIALTAVLYLVMHFVFAYVDIGWDSQSMLYVGAMMGLLGSLEHIVAKPTPLPAKRWRWQPDPRPIPELLPLHENTPVA